jgi:hypothetical protein
MNKEYFKENPILYLYLCSSFVLPLIIGTFAINLGFNGIALIIFMFVWATYPLAIILSIRELFATDIIKKIPILEYIPAAIFIFQIGVTYSFSFDILFAGLGDANNPIDFIFQLLGNITGFCFLGLFIGTMSMGGHIASWFTF